MHKPSKTVALITLYAWLLSSQSTYGEDVKDTRITPTQQIISGEHFHGSIIQGKLLIKVMMFGAVPTQGIHYVHEGTDILSAMLYAGGYDDTSKITGITIRRKNHKQLIRVNLEDLIENGDEAPKLMDDDIVTVPFNWRRDISTISLITGFITSITGFTLALIALVRTNN